MPITFNPSITNSRYNSRKQSPAFGGYYLEQVVPLKGIKGLGIAQRLIDSDTFGVLKKDADALIKAYKDSDEGLRARLKDLFIGWGMEYPPKT